MTALGSARNDTVTRIARLNMTLGPARWNYAAHHAEAIDRHWAIATAQNPAFFNGVIHVIDRLDIDGEHCNARLLATDFKSFLYWRDEGFPEEGGVLDGFGSALIRSADGCILLGRQRAGNINAGLTYLPGGFIDARDVAADGHVDLARSVARELKEETGLEAGTGAAAALRAEPGVLLTRTAAQASFAVIYNSQLTASDLVDRAAAHIAAEADPELAELVAVSRTTDLASMPMPHFARVLVGNALAWR